MQRCRSIALRNIGLSLAVSALALKARAPIVGSFAHQGTRPQRKADRSRSPGSCDSTDTASTVAWGAMFQRGTTSSEGTSSLVHLEQAGYVLDRSARDETTTHRREPYRQTAPVRTDAGWRSDAGSLDEAVSGFDGAGVCCLLGAGLALHLEGRMRDTEAALNRGLHPFSYDLGLFQAGMPVEHDVGGKGSHVAGQAPAVKVVHGRHSFDGRHRRGESGRRRGRAASTRGARPGSRDEAPGLDADQQGDEQPYRRVEGLEATGREDHRAGHDHPERGGRVTGEMQGHGAEIQVLGVVAQQQRRDRVA